MNKVGVSMKFQTNYTGEDVDVSRDDDYDVVRLGLGNDFLEMEPQDLETLIKVLTFFRDRRDESVLDTGLSIPNDQHVAFP